eukprot:40612-Prorocentrum_minimum.AAC.1
MAAKTVPFEVEKKLAEVGLVDKADDLAKNLSGGQRRKLSLAIAFIGEPQVIILVRTTRNIIILLADPVDSPVEPVDLPAGPVDPHRSAHTQFGRSLGRQDFVTQISLHQGLSGQGLER